MRHAALRPPRAHPVACACPALCCPPTHPPPRGVDTCRRARGDTWRAAWQAFYKADLDEDMIRVTKLFQAAPSLGIRITKRYAGQRGAPAHTAATLSSPLSHTRQPGIREGAVARSKKKCVQVAPRSRPELGAACGTVPSRWRTSRPRWSKVRRPPPPARVSLVAFGFRAGVAPGQPPRATDGGNKDDSACHWETSAACV